MPASSVVIVLPRPSVRARNAKNDTETFAFQCGLVRMNVAPSVDLETQSAPKLRARIGVACVLLAKINPRR
jgi:hypothetical protein